MNHSGKGFGQDFDKTRLRQQRRVLKESHFIQEWDFYDSHFRECLGKPYCDQTRESFKKVISQYLDHYPDGTFDQMMSSLIDQVINE